MEGAQWVGRSTMTGVHFGPCVWSGLCLLGVWSGFTKCGPQFQVRQLLLPFAKSPISGFLLRCYNIILFCLRIYFFNHPITLVLCGTYTASLFRESFFAMFLFSLGFSQGFPDVSLLCLSAALCSFSASSGKSFHFLIRDRLCVCPSCMTASGWFCIVQIFVSHSLSLVCGENVREKKLGFHAEDRCPREVSIQI